MEEIVSAHSAVAECAVIGIHCPMKGQVPLALVIIKNGFTITEDDLQAQLKQEIREKIGGIASLKQVLIVERLPKTRSGKILRKVMRQMIDGKEVQVPSTIDDKEIIPELEVIFKNSLV
jgi:propionyl-CoA synthetase